MKTAHQSRDDCAKHRDFLARPIRPICFISGVMGKPRVEVRESRAFVELGQCLSWMLHVPYQTILYSHDDCLQRLVTLICRAIVYMDLL
jgi:hypothetical protein